MKKFYQVEFEYLDQVAWRGEAETPEAAIKFVEEWLAENKVRGTKILGAKEVPALYPDEDEISAFETKRTVN